MSLSFVFPNPPEDEELKKKKGRGDHPIFCTGVKPLARVVQYLKRIKKTFGEIMFLGAAFEDNPSIAD